MWRTKSVKTFCVRTLAWGLSLNLTAHLSALEVKRVLTLAREMEAALLLVGILVDLGFR